MHAVLRVAHGALGALGDELAVEFILDLCLDCLRVLELQHLEVLLLLAVDLLVEDVDLNLLLRALSLQPIYERTTHPVYTVKLPDLGVAALADGLQLLILAFEELRGLVCVLE